MWLDAPRATARSIDSTQMPPDAIIWRNPPYSKRRTPPFDDIIRRVSPFMQPLRRVLEKIHMEIEGAQASTPRPLRADARQNFERLIAAASVAIGELGPNVSLDEVAKRAGVGIGTLYRHFPNRQALLEAV